MGGKALKKVKVSRIQLSEYNIIKEVLINKLKELNIKASVPFEIPGKCDFGDIDILVETNDFDIKKWILSNFNPVDIFYNGSVISFAYQSKINDEDVYYQIDIIKVAHLEAAMLFFSYGDVGAIIGRYSGFHGIMFSEDGITIKIRGDLLDEEDTEHVHKKVHITSDPVVVCDMLGLNYSYWQTGFTTIDQIYDWVKSSKYFSTKIFRFINMKKRKRIGMRPFYINFLNNIGVNSEQIGNIDNKINNDERKNNQLRILGEYNKLHLISEIKNDLALQRHRKEKFNGYIFLESGAVKENLSLTIFNFKNDIEKRYETTFENWLDLFTKDQIRDEIFHFVNL